jgi:hypothetical protein
MTLSARTTFLRWFRDLAGPLLGVAFPAGCRLCDRRLLNASRLPVCDLCLSSFKRLTAELCPLCGQALAPGEMLGEESDLCRGCQEQRYAFSVARSFGVYRDVLVRAILLLKYERVDPLGDWFAKRLAELINSEPGLLNADVMSPSPCIASDKRNVASIRLTSSAAHSPVYSGFRIAQFCWSASDPAPNSICFATTSAGKRYVALLLYKRACELTICGSCF